jgi:flagellar biosynthesis/type III secretory pathway protein FliH
LVCEDAHYEQFTKVIREQVPELERQTMTIAEELIQRGRVEGRAEGRVEGRAELLVKQLVHKFGELPSEYVSRITDASDEQLERYAVRVVTVDTLARVFADD